MEKRLLLFSIILSFFFIGGVLFSDNLILKNIFIFLFGISTAGNFSMTFSIGAALFPKYANSVAGLMVTFAHLGIMVFQYLSGYAAEHWSNNSILYINISILFVLIILTTVLNLSKRFSEVSV